MRVRKRAYELLGVAKSGDTASKIVNVFIVSLIGLNVLAMILWSIARVRSVSPRAFWVFECVSVGIFTVEYLLRVWSCVEEARFNAAVGGRVRFALTPMALIDFLAIAPFYLPFTGMDLRFLRILRMMRIFRIAKLARYSRSLQTMRRVVLAKKEPLTSTAFILVLLIIIAASMLYFAENRVQPEVFSSIPAAMWWAVTTLTSVGYGDIFPVTLLGKLMASVIAILGIGMFALPTAILGAGFIEEMNQGKRETRCPHCGKKLEGE